MTSKSRLSPGFTLIELLVSVTIIIALAGLIFAITNKVRDSARQSVAMSALRQIGIANVAYATENSGAINVVRDAGEWGPWEGNGMKFATNSFIGRMAPYLFPGLDGLAEKEFATQTRSSLKTLFKTTDLKTMEGTLFEGVTVTTDGSGLPNPISVNQSLRPRWGRDNPFLRLSAFEDPSGILYLTYGRYYFDEKQASAYRPLPKPGDRTRTIYYLPNRKAIFAFLDGHVEMLTPPISERYFPERPTVNP